ncbi:single-stranded-DNA-specific exonuclease RecJ [Zongyangia hominis]|uniref:Single-stranded-DNA-specific exonuclease RecJ n=1 Tax=Zongyangia hominis TaxID=2763677 RepID=A0A926EDL7_9FIRM|nr:single-stranded-DNA-specific exonuclease RecJ [Zongyangia hominis]MBC8569817.1 single-stranded-DNA-specific exonuclease RecJ [Zongyangia hominis]
MELKRWKVARSDPNRARQMGEALGVDELVCDVLLGRGYGTQEEIRGFLEGSPTFFDPFLLKDMDKAVERIQRAVEEGEVIAVYGDYDCDGMTATYLVYTYLENVGADVFRYIPDRDGEGYGLNKGAVDRIKERGASLIVTVDNGISALEEIAYAGTLGIDVVVTDHHQPPEVLPNACAVVDPHRADCGSPYKNLAGVGVAFKLLCALDGDDGWGMMEHYGDIVAIGTVGDVVSLDGENRLLVKEGLKILKTTENMGVSALLSSAGLDREKLTSESVAFGIVPRINAAGRLGETAKALELLLSEDEEEAARLAEEMSELNRKRQALGNEITVQVRTQLERDPQKRYQKVIMLESEEWHHGIIGIVASKVVERYGKPCFLISTEGDVARGSGRSVEGFPMAQALGQTSAHLTRFGGHDLAAGFSLYTDDIPLFERDFVSYCDENFPQMPPLSIQIDHLLTPSELTVQKIKALEVLEPYGAGNPSPLFGVQGVKVDKVYPLSEGKHCKIRLTKGEEAFYALYFGMSPDRLEYAAGDMVDVAVSCEISSYRGVEQLSVKIRDIRPSGVREERLFATRTLYDDYRRGKELTAEERAKLAPTREEIAYVYRFLREKRFVAYGEDLLFVRAVGDKMDYAKMRVALDVLCEMGLAAQVAKNGKILTGAVKNPTKVNLDDSRILQRLRQNTGR